VLPSFLDDFGWEVCQQTSRSNERRCFAIRTTWRRHEDYGKCESPVERLKHIGTTLEPTIETETIELSSDLVDSFLDRFRSITLPAFVDLKSIGCDGTSYEFCFGRYFLSARYHWWETPPDEWKPLSEAVSEILKYLESKSTKASG